MDQKQIQSEIEKMQAIDQASLSDVQRAKHTEALMHMQQLLRLTS